MSKDAADVIAKGVRTVRGRVIEAPTFESMSAKLRNLAKQFEGRAFIGVIAYDLQEIANLLDTRHDHADPCDDEACPCRAAEAEHQHDQGRGTP